MSESLEHRYLSAQFLAALREFSRLDLYGFTESDRKRFDFACLLTRDYERPLVGQTLWSHSDGIDKDLRTLVVAEDAAIWSYIVRDNVRSRMRIEEVISDFRQSQMGSQLFKLKLFWVPDDFEAGNPNAERTVARYLRASVVNDILFNVVFGNLSAGDIRYFLSTTGIFGLNLIILHFIAFNGYNGASHLAKGVKANTTSVRERYQEVRGSGFVYEADLGLRPIARGRFAGYASTRGRVFLNLLNQIHTSYKAGTFSQELRYILERLEIEPVENREIPGLDDRAIEEWLRLPRSAQKTFAMLVATAITAERRGFRLGRTDFLLDPYGEDLAKDIGR